MNTVKIGRGELCVLVCARKCAYHFENVVSLISGDILVIISSLSNSISVESKFFYFEMCGCVCVGGFHSLANLIPMY